MAVDGPIKAGEFKARCLELMDRVAERGDVFIITKRGKAVAQLGPVGNKPRSLFGFLAGDVEIVGDVVGPLDVDWGPRPARARRKRTRRTSR